MSTLNSSTTREGRLAHADAGEQEKAPPRQTGARAVARRAAWLVARIGRRAQRRSFRRLSRVALADGPSARSLALRFLLGLLVLYGLVATLGRALAEPLQAVGRELVSHFGLPGFALGAFLADGIHFPVPPQFYMLLTVALDLPVGLALLSISAGSLLGGALEYFAARRIRRIPWVERRMERTGAARLLAIAEQHPYRWVVIGSLTPISHSWLCFFVGFARLTFGAFLIVSLLRLPKLMLYFAIVRAGWTSAAA